MKRRDFLSQAALLASTLAIPQMARGALGFNPLSVVAATTGPVPYPLLLIFLRGGADPAMHFTAASGSVGNVSLVNRPSSSTFKKTASGITYFPGTVAPSAAPDFEKYIPEMALVRAVDMDGQSHGDNRPAMWFGSRGGRQMWANLLSSNLRQRSKVLKPVGLAYPDPSFTGDDPVGTSNLSPDPAAAAERILSVSAWLGSLAPVPSPLPAQKLGPAYSLTRTLDGTTYPASQPDILNVSQEATAAADSVLNSISPTSPVVWPPSQQTLSALGLTPTDIAGTIHGMPNNKAMLAASFQALAHNVSHMVSFEVEGYDSHTDNINRQTSSSNAIFPSIGKLIALMKATPSPIDPSKSLYDTTNIWIQSEMGRSPQADSSAGTAHWRFTNSAFLGGRFKRGIAVGNFDSNWAAVPFDLATGSTSSGSPSAVDLTNLISTVFKVCGYSDPTLYNGVRPIDAIINPAA